MILKQLTTFTINLVAGANVATVILMLLTGYSSYVNPASFPLLSTMGIAFPMMLLANLAFLIFWLLFKWRRIWIPVAGYALAYVPINIYMPLHLRQDVPDGAIKVVSYNVCHYGGNYKYENGFETVFDYLQQQNADIVCIEEDVDTWRRYVFQKYRKLYEYNDTMLIYCPNGDVNGLGIHTKFPILRRERIEYKSIGNGSVAYYLQTGDDTLLVVINHLETIHMDTDDRNRYTQILKGDMERKEAEDESKAIVKKLGYANTIRAEQARAVHQYVEDHRQYPIIVCGDFNDTPISYTHQTIAKGLTDCFRESGAGVGLSYNRKGFPVRIDHFFCSSHFEPYNCHVDNKIDASDHYPMVCWLKKRDI